jgi:hypothetical protein
MENINNPPNYIAKPSLSLVPVSTEKANGPQIILTPIIRDLVESPTPVSALKPIQIVYPYSNQSQENQAVPIYINETYKKPNKRENGSNNIKNKPLKSSRLIRDNEKETFDDGVIKYLYIIIYLKEFVLYS